MRLFVFDIDGTVTDSIRAHHQSFEKACSDLGIRIDTAFGSFTHHTDSWIFGEIFQGHYGRSPNPSERQAFSDAVSSNFHELTLTEGLRGIAGAAQFIQLIVSDESSAYVFATGSFRRAAVRKVSSLGLEVPPELMVTADDFETREDIVSNAILAAQRYYGVERFDQVVSIGDGHWDVVAAKNLTLDFVGIGSDVGGDKLRAAGAKHVFPDFSCGPFLSVASLTTLLSGT